MTDAQLERLLALDGKPGPALPIDAADADAIVEAALAGAGFGPGPSGGGSGNSGASASGAGTSGGTAVGTKLAILGGAALVVIAIAIYVGRGRHRGHEVAIAPIDAAIIDVSGGGGSIAASSEVPSPAASPEPAEAPPPDASDEPTTEPSIDEEITIEPTAPKRQRSATLAKAASAADLLGEANAKRAAKLWREADALYARVAKQAPKSLAAQTALIASASIRLEHLGDPKGAAQRLRRALALAPSGALAEEARWGLAEAARATRDRKAEAAALDDFLAHHAGSPLASRAKARRAELP